MEFYRYTFVLRLALAAILVMHGLPTILNGSISEFGNGYLASKGFGSFGLVLAWAIKLSHLAAAVCFLLDRWVVPAGIVTIIILVAGIIMIHWAEGWYVVGFSRNGIEFNLLLIAGIITLMKPYLQRRKVPVQ